MLKTVEGIFRSGKVELSESAPAKDGDLVLVTFLPQKEPQKPVRYMEFGMLRIDSGRESTWEDFVEAKRAMLKPFEADDGTQARG